MKLADLTSPGTIPNSQKLRVELLKAINYVQLEGMKRGHGSTGLPKALVGLESLVASGRHGDDEGDGSRTSLLPCSH